MCEICSKVAIKTTEQWEFMHCSDVSIVDFKLVNTDLVVLKIFRKVHRHATSIYLVKLRAVDLQRYSKGLHL